MAGKVKADWEKVAVHYRAGIRTLRDIAKEFGITEGAIRKRAKAEEWPRDLSVKIKAKADDVVRKALVRNGTIGTKEKDMVDAAGQTLGSIRTEQMIAATRARKQAEEMLAELSSQSGQLGEYHNLMEMMHEATESGDTSAIDRAYKKVLSFTGRVGNFKALTESLVKTIELERKAYGIELMPPVEEEFDEIVIRRITAPPPGTAYFPLDPDGKP